MVSITSDHLVLVAVLGLVILGSGATIQYVFLGESLGGAETSVDHSLIVPSGEFTADEISAGNAISEIGTDGDTFRFGFEAESDEIVEILVPVENRADVDLLARIGLTQVHGSEAAAVRMEPTGETFGNDCTVTDVVRSDDLSWEFPTDAHCQDYVGIYVNVPSDGPGSYVYEGTLRSVGQTSPGDVGDEDLPDGSLEFADQTVDDDDRVTISGVNFTNTQDGTVTLAVVNPDGDEIGARTVSSSGDYQLELDPTGFESGESLTAAMYETEERERILDSATAQIFKQGYFAIQSTETNSPVTEGDPLLVTADIENTGDETVSQVVRLNIDGVEMDNESMLLAPGDNESVQLEWQTVNGDAGGYDATVLTDDEFDTSSVTVEESDDTENFSVDITGTNSPIGAGDTLQVTTEIENVGNLTGEQDIELEIGGQIRETESVQLAPGDSTSILLEWATSAGDVGQHTANVTSDDDQESTDVTVEDPASFEVTIDNTNSPVVEGDVLQVTATLENTGDVSGEQDIELDIDGAVRDVETVSLAGGATDTVVLEWATASGDGGDHTANVTSEDDQDNASVTVLEEAAYAVTITDTNSPVGEGQALEVTVDIENTGEVSGQQDVQLEIDGTVEDVESISVAGGDTQTIVLEWATADGDAGTYNATVFSDDDQDETTVEVDDPMGEQVQFVAGSTGTFGQSQSEIEFDLSSVSGRDGEIVGIAVNESTQGNHIDHASEDTFRSPDTAGQYNGQIDIGGPRVTLQDAITVTGGATQTYHLGEFRSEVNNDPVNMVNEDVTITLYFADGSTYEVSLTV